MLKILFTLFCLNKLKMKLEKSTVSNATSEVRYHNITMLIVKKKSTFILRFG